MNGGMTNDDDDNLRSVRICVQPLGFQILRHIGKAPGERDDTGIAGVHHTKHGDDSDDNMTTEQRRERQHAKDRCV